jgi:hypothetical protein
MTCRMGIPLCITIAGDLNRGILIHETGSNRARFSQDLLQGCSPRQRVHRGKIEVFGEAIGAEVAFLERGTSFEDQSAGELWDLADAGQEPGEEIVPFEYRPRQSRALALLLEAQVERPHGATFPGRFSWIIHRWWYGPRAGLVGSSFR